MLRQIFFLDKVESKPVVIRGQAPVSLSFPLPPLSDLEGLISLYYEKLERDLEDLQLNPNFSDGAESLYRDANMFSLISLAIALSPEESLLSPMTPALLAVSQKVAHSKNQREAKAAFEEFQDALKSSGDPSALRWTKVVHLAPIMKKAIPALSTEIKRLTRNESTFNRGNNSEKVILAAAALAVGAIGCRPNVDETLAPHESALWEQYCDQLYTASLKFNEIAHQVVEGTSPFSALSTAFEAMDATCNGTCHEKFGGNTSGN